MGDKTWFEQYDQGVPHTLEPYPERTLVDVVAESASQRPLHPALLFQGWAISYAELDRLSTTFTRALITLGVEKGERVALLLPNCPQFVLAFLGSCRAGAIAVPLNPLYTERELEHALATCGAETVVVLTPFYEKVKTIQPRTQIRRVIATNIKEYLPPLKRILFTLAKEKKDGHRIALHSGDYWLAEMLREHAGATPPDVAISPDDPAFLLFSGGTTGRPKAALGTHRALVTTGLQIHAWFKNLIVDWDDVIMLNLPLFHAYGLLGVLAAGLTGHNILALIPNPRDLDDLLATMHRIRPAFLPGVPTLFNALLNHPRVRAGHVDLTSLKLCISGAAPLLAETKQRFESITGARIVEAYALTESMLGANMSPVFGLYKPGSIGIPLPDIDVRIADAETGQEDLEPGQMGEILMRAPQLMQGYWENPAETADTLRDGWLHTGDIGYQDEDGYLFLVDRKKDLIKPSGFQVWPREVEEVIAAHPAVLEVCVAGVPDATYAEAVKAWVVLHPNRQIGESDLRDFCRQELAGYKVPRFVEFRDSLPKSTVGKILRRQLVTEEREQAMAATHGELSGGRERAAV